jgi:hypothetical protein
MWKAKANPLKLFLVVMLCTLSVPAFIIYFTGCTIVFAKQVQLTSHIPPPRTVVSISTFGKRIFHMGPCLNGVFSQSQQPDRVIISIPKKTHRQRESTACPVWDTNCLSDPTHYDESQTSILAWFQNYTGVAQALQTNHSVFEFPPRLTVQFLDVDWGPATKALGALRLEQDPDTIIITFDDDMVYNQDTVRWLASHMDRQAMALSFGCEMWDGFHVNFETYTTLSPKNLFASTPRVCSGWLLGWTAVAYRVSNFGNDVWTYLDRLPHGCFYNDDIWLSGYIARRGVLKVYVPGVMDHLHHRRDKELSLSTIVGSRERYGLPCARALFE